ATAVVFGSVALRQKLVQEIVSEVLLYEYDGIDVDFEHIKTTNKAAFHLFLGELQQALHDHHKFLSVAIPGKRNDVNWAGYEYEAIGPLVDRFKIMTYGYSGSWSRRPGPIAPITWI